MPKIIITLNLSIDRPLSSPELLDDLQDNIINVLWDRAAKMGLLNDDEEAMVTEVGADVPGATEYASLGLTKERIAFLRQVMDGDAAGDW